MSKSILLVFAAGALIAAPLAVAGHGAPQAAQTPAATQTPAPGASGDTIADVAGVPGDMTNPVVKPTAASQAKAKEIYSMDCAMCHGDNGNGKTDLATSLGVVLPNLTDAKSLANQMDGQLFNQIRNGKDKMPSEAKARASDSVVWNLIIYVRGFSKPQSAEATAK